MISGRLAGTKRIRSRIRRLPRLNKGKNRFNSSTIVPTYGASRAGADFRRLNVSRKGAKALRGKEGEKIVDRGQGVGRTLMVGFKPAYSLERSFYAAWFRTMRGTSHFA